MVGRVQVGVRAIKAGFGHKFKFWLVLNADLLARNRLRLLVTSTGLVMRSMSLFLVCILSFHVFAGDLWEITSTSIAPDGTPIPYTQNLCFPQNSIDPAEILDGLGTCTFDQKNGTPTAMTFIMTCKTAGMPAEVGAIKVTGDANLGGNKFTMNYVISIGENQSASGDNFKMNGKAEASKLGHCDDR